MKPEDPEDEGGKARDDPAQKREDRLILAGALVVLMCISLPAYGGVYGIVPGVLCGPAMALSWPAVKAKNILACAVFVVSAIMASFALMVSGIVLALKMMPQLTHGW